MGTNSPGFIIAWRILLDISSAGKRRVSSAKSAKSVFIKEGCDVHGREAALLQQPGDEGELRRGLFRNRLGALDRAQGFWVGKDLAQQVTGGGVLEVGVGEALYPRAVARKLDRELVGGDIAGDQDRRVAEVALVEQELGVGGAEVGILPLGLILPGEAVAKPDIGEAGPTAALGEWLLEAVEIPVGISLIRRLGAEQATQVEKVLLGGGLLVQRYGIPLCNEPGSYGGNVGHRGGPVKAAGDQA